jgi:signal transduction histidine kinase
MQEKFNSDLISLIASFFFFFLLVFFIVITIAIRYRKRKKENDAMKVLFSEQLLKSQLEIQEQTLQHVSRELHDNIGQIASLIKINLNTLQLQHAEAAEVKLANTKELTRQLITDLKLLSTSLNGDKMNRIGLMKALQNEADKINKTGIFSGKFIQHDAVPVVSDEKAIIIYRMAQEILNNALKHSEATEIIIEAWYAKNTFILVIADDGKGFDVQEKMADITDGGNGLINLQKRAKVINATISINSAPASGTKTRIELIL